MSTLLSEVGVEFFLDLACHALPGFGTDQRIACERLAQILDWRLGDLVGPFGQRIDHEHLRQCSEAREVHQFTDKSMLVLGFGMALFLW